MFDDGNPFPYVLTVINGTELEDTKKYTVVICGYTKNVEDSRGIHDTKICGMDALRSYLTDLGKVRKSTICG